MNSIRACCTILLIGLLLASCGRSPAPVVSVKIPAALKADYDKTTPTAKFVFYAVKGTEPKSQADFRNRTLFVCCGIALEDIPPFAGNANPIEIPPLFAVAQTYGISDNLSCKSDDGKPHPGATDEMAPRFNGQAIQFKGKGLVFCHDSATKDEILRLAVDDMRASRNGMLLMARGSEPPASDFVEVTFQ